MQLLVDIIVLIHVAQNKQKRFHLITADFEVTKFPFYRLFLLLSSPLPSGFIASVDFRGYADYNRF